MPRVRVRGRVTWSSSRNAAESEARRVPAMRRGAVRRSKVERRAALSGTWLG